MAWRLVCEYVKMPIHGSSLYMLSATWMATSSALMIVWVSSWPDVSMYVVVLWVSVLQLLLFGVALFLGNRLYKSSRWVCVGVAMVWVVGEMGLLGVLWGFWLVGVCDVYPCLSLCS
jgi:hypothetical protein